MSREEQIKKAAHDFSWGWCDDKAHPLNDGFIEGAKWVDQHPHWIPVEERLPEFVYPIGAEVKNTSDYVLVYNGYTMYISRLVGGEIHWWEDNSELAPTHWMPIVPPRKEE
jgi:hypothetical protein